MQITLEQLITERVPDLWLDHLQVRGVWLRVGATRSNNSFERTVKRRGRAVLAMDCVLAGAEVASAEHKGVRSFNIALQVESR